MFSLLLLSLFYVHSFIKIIGIEPGHYDCYYPVGMVPSKKRIFRVGIDTGGTFTDIVWCDGARLGMSKVPSRPDAPAEAVLEGLKKVPAVSSLVCHGTTVGTNAVLARHGGPARMVVTKGFRDVLEIGRGEREQLNSLSPSRPKPLLGRDEILEIDVRFDADGNQIGTPDEESFHLLVENLKRSGAKALAVGILHSATQPSPERILAQVLTDHTGIPAFPSAGLAAYPREYERWSLAALTAYLAPVLGKYLAELSGRCPADLALMASSGGLVSPDQVLKNPAICVLSGPAGGALAALATGRDRILALDMGGTSTDVTLLAGRLPRTREAAIDGLPVPLPAIDIHTIGAGGGSIVKIDSGGMLALGPDSAGAMPGPACYGYGGPATLSDVALLSGRLVPNYFLGGDIKLDGRASVDALEKIAPDGMSVDKLVDGVLELAIVHLTGALRKISIARGIDPALPDASYTLIPFGGAGAFFAVECARSLGLREAVHPHAAGVYSAIGLMLAPVSAECETAIIRPVDQSVDIIRSARDQLVRDLAQTLEQWPQTEGPIFIATLECRYRGQTHTLEIPLADEIDVSRIRRDFEKAYIERYTYLHDDADIEIVSIRVRGELPAPPFEFPDVETADRHIDAAKIDDTNLRLDGSWRVAPVYDRYRIPIDSPITGPALIIDYHSTLYLPPDATARLDRKGNVVVEIE